MDDTERYDVLIIGSGLGGLLCGYILAKEGMKVCIIEKHFQVGGCLQTFNRDGCTFDTGVHYVGGLGKGQNLYRYFKYFGIIDNTIMHKLDSNYDKIVINDKEYWHASGYENFEESLVSRFPSHASEIHNYTKRIREICRSFPLYNLRELSPSMMETPLFQEKVYDFMQSVTANEELQKVLAGANLLYAGVKEKTPLYIHALISNSNIEGSYRFVGGSTQIADVLCRSIENFGGKIYTKAEAVRFNFDDKLIQSVELASGEVIHAKQFISSIHPVRTLEMIGKGKIRPAYRSRVNSIENTISTFILYITLKPNTFPYLNYNIYNYDQNEVYISGEYDKLNWPPGYMMLTPVNPKSDKYADCLTVMTVMRYEEVMKWEGTKIGHRGPEYEEFKQQKAERLLDFVEKRFPNIRSCIKNVYSSTPLTYKDYTGTEKGAIYGIMKDSNNIMQSLILPKTKIPNLFLTGQNTNIHGVLGVTIGALLTCGSLIDINYLVNKIRRETE